MFNPFGPLGSRILARSVVVSPAPLADLAIRRIERDLLRAIEHGDRAAITMLQSRRTFWLARRALVN